MVKGIAAVGIALALAVAGAQAQTVSKPAAAASAAAECPNARDLESRQLIGLWRVEFEGLARGATLLLEPHRQYAQSLSGEVNRDGERSKVAADLDEGDFTLEESADGVHIAATWLGDVVEGSCGNEIRGSWGPASGTARGFVMRRAGR
jgi:hypothetical protein